ncbi:MAG: response regulator [Alteromonadaceae bacterium]|nr:MAG: response regulator [Alteromonadaceae bacterium]
MKQIDIIKTYTQKHCLIVEDEPDTRTQLKRIMNDFGCPEVDTAGGAEEAIELCERKQYDMVLSDYNLGKGKNGQQLLEELRYHHHLPRTSLFIMTTAESSSRYVLHALEYQPDEYLSKPLNRETLRKRLDQALLKNEALQPTLKALENNKLKSAMAACMDALTEHPRFSHDIKKVLGELLHQCKLHDDAAALYQNYPNNKRPLWAQIGLARAWYELKQLSKAEQLLKQVTKENSLCLDAIELLAKVYEALNKPQKAQVMLEQAVKLSPMSAVLQREMGRLSELNGDTNASVLAYRAAVKNAKNSCHENPEDYTNLTRSLSKLMSCGSQANSEKVGAEALETLKSLDKKYGRRPVVKLHSKLLEAEIHENRGQNETAQRALQEAVNQQAALKLTTIDGTSTQLCVDCAKSLMRHGQYDGGEKMLQQVANTDRGPGFTIKIDKLLREPLTTGGVKLAAKLNKKGIELYQADKAQEAVNAFEMVLHELPNHIGLNLNLIQSIISKNKEKPANPKEIAQMREGFKRIGNLNQDSSYHKRYTYLQKQYNKISTSS